MPQATQVILREANLTSAPKTSTAFISTGELLDLRAADGAHEMGASNENGNGYQDSHSHDASHRFSLQVCGSRGQNNGLNSQESGRREPRDSHRQLAREIKSKLEHRFNLDQRANAGTTSGGCATNATIQKQLDQQTSQLDALISGNQKSWSEQRTVIVNIDNSSRGKRAKEVGVAELRPPSPPLASKDNGNSVAREVEQNRLDSQQETARLDRVAETAKLAVGSQLKSDSSAKSRTAERVEGRAGLEDATSAIRQSQRARGPISTSASSRNKKQQDHDKPSTDAPQLGRELSSSVAAEGTRGREVEPASSKPKSRLPTFGAIPGKLSRLPYFSYYGRARNVDITTAEDRNAAAAARDTQLNSHSKTFDGGEGSSSTTSLNSSSRSSSAQSSTPLSGGSSRIPTLTRTSGDRQKYRHYSSSRPVEIESDDIDTIVTNNRRRASRVADSGVNWRGYSNISNLFPSPSDSYMRHQQASSRQTRPTSGSSGLLEPNRRQASSLSNLSPRPASRREYSHQPPTAATRFVSSSTSTRRNSFSNNQTQANQGQRIRSSQSSLLSPISPSERLANMRRQNKIGGSSTGIGGGGSGYTSGGVGSKQQVSGPRGGTFKGRPSSASGYLTKHHRSPSASSLLYSSGIGMSPYGPPILDPDCPVHGYPERGTSGQPASKSTLNLAGNDANLLYENYPSYYDTRPANTHRNRAASLYSPNSPTSPPTYNKRSAAPNYSTSNRYGSSNAYYNNSSRFSLYHPTEAGVRSHLAPTSEQLRRILGYQPLTKPVHLHPQWAYSRPFIHLQGRRSPSPAREDGVELDEFAGIRFEPFNRLQDAQAIRAVDFHPSGEVYAIGSNSRALRICAYPADHELRHFSPEQHELESSPRVLFKFLQVHRGSIYCVSFNENGQLLATGSNDQTVHIVRYNPTTHSPDGEEFRLTMHDGTVRDLCFLDDITNGSSLLLSAGGGDNKIYVTDCDTITPFQSMAGHTQMVMSLSHLAGATFVSGSYDKTIRFWDLRTRNCTSIISAPPNYGTAGNWVGPGAPVCAVKVDPSGRMLASGHSDSTCMLYDIRGAKIIQTFRPHDDEIRTLSFSPKSYYLLSGGYDGRVVLSDLQGDLTQPLPSVCAAESDDKIVQAKWHPSDFTFVTTSADKSATLWALPQE